MNFVSRSLTQTETWPGTLKLRRNIVCVAIVFAYENFDKCAFGRDVAHLRPIISLWSKSFKRAFAILWQGFSGCYCDFNATISMSGVRKVPSRSSRICSVVLYLRETLPSEEVKSLVLLDRSENLGVSPSRTTRTEVCTNL